MIKKLLIALGILSLSAFILSSFLKEEQPKQLKINGLALEAPSKPVSKEYFTTFEPMGADWICLMPYAYSPSESADVIFNESKGQWWGERLDGTEECIKMGQEAGLKIMLKPHLWIGHGQFTGDLNFETNEDWTAWENNYKHYILTYAELAEKHDVALLCIGTELKNFVAQRTSFWNEMIAEIKDIYTGKLTYAGNWDSYKDVPFWNEMDYIGVDAYFPLSEDKDPSLDELKKGWIPWIEEMKTISEASDRPILLTEYGYCSVDFSCKEPWKQDMQQQVNEELQQRAYQALFESLWDQPFFEGGFTWKWHVPDHFDENRMKKRFSPQEKLAEKTLIDWYSKNP